jgi:antitoxin ParD1/3/4
MMFDNGKSDEMATGKAIRVELGPQRSILQRQLESGLYENASEVLRDALRALDERDAVYDEFLRAKVRASMANKRPNVPIGEAFDRARAAIARKAKAARRGA